MPRGRQDKYDGSIFKEERASGPMGQKGWDSYGKQVLKRKGEKYPIETETKDEALSCPGSSWRKDPMSIAPTSVWIIIEKDRQGEPRGVEKAFQSRYYMDKKEAESTLDSIPPSLSNSFMVAEVVMMGRAEFDRDYNPKV